MAPVPGPEGLGRRVSPNLRGGISPASRPISRLRVRDFRPGRVRALPGAFSAGGGWVDGLRFGLQHFGGIGEGGMLCFSAGVIAHF